MGCIPGNLKWLKPAQMHNHKNHYRSRVFYLIRCIWFLRLWGLFEETWLQLEWSPQWSDVKIMAKELLPIVLNCAAWDPILPSHEVLFQSDNSSVVAAIQKGSAKDSIIMHLLHSLLIVFVAHIAGVDICTADHLSRCSMHNFFSINPQASTILTPVSPLLQLQSLTTQGPDWISTTFKQLFLSIINEA